MTRSDHEARLNSGLGKQQLEGVEDDAFFRRVSAGGEQQRPCPVQIKSFPQFNCQRICSGRQPCVEFHVSGDFDLSLVDAQRPEAFGVCICLHSGEGNRAENPPHEPFD
jgi:hypothetical protein